MPDHSENPAKSKPVVHDGPDKKPDGQPRPNGAPPEIEQGRGAREDAESVAVNPAAQAREGTTTTTDPPPKDDAHEEQQQSGNVNPGQGSAAVSNVKQDDFKQREGKIFGRYEAAIKEYRNLGRWYLRRHRVISVALLVSAVLSPVLIASNNDLFGLPEAQGIWLTRGAVVLSLVVALLEGIRRIFKYDDRATAAYHAQRDLVLARERYRMYKLRNPDLTPERFAAFEAFWRTYYEDVYARETSGWTATFRNEEPTGGKQAAPPQAGPKPETKN